MVTIVKSHCDVRSMELKQSQPSLVSKLQVTNTRYKLQSTTLQYRLIIYFYQYLFFDFLVLLFLFATTFGTFHDIVLKSSSSSTTLHTYKNRILKTYTYVYCLLKENLNRTCTTHVYYTRVYILTHFTPKSPHKLSHHPTNVSE